MVDTFDEIRIEDIINKYSNNLLDDGFETFLVVTIISKNNFEYNL